VPPVTCIPCSVPVGEGDVCGYHTCADEWKVAPQRGHHTNRAITMPDPVLQTDGCLRSDPSNVQEKERQLELELDHILNFRHATRRGTTCCKLFVRCKRCPGSSVSCLPVPPTQPTQPFLGERGDTPYYGDARLRGTDLSFHGSAAA